MRLHRPPVCLALALTSTLFASASPAAADCVFTPALPATIQTKCVQAVAINGKPLLSYDISWFSTERNEYYLGDRSNAGVDVIVRNHQTHKWEWKRILGGFKGAVPNGSGGINNNVSGPDGVTAHGRWLYAGDGDSTLKVFDLDAPTASALKNTIATGGSTRVDEMALTTDGQLLIAANNAEDPPFATLFRANGDEDKDHTKILGHISVDLKIIPKDFGLSLEQPAWDPTTRRYYTSIPVIANNPKDCNYGQNSGPITCDGGVLVTDPDAIEDAFHGKTVMLVQGAFNKHTNTGVVPLHSCGPNGATVGPDDNILFGCTPANNPSDVIQLVMNAMSKAQTQVANITGSDEVWFNKGDGRYYTASNRNCATFPGPCGSAKQQAAVLGVIDAGTNKLIETVPQSSGSHSVAADARHNFIFVPQNAGNSKSPSTEVGHDTTDVGSGICGTLNGCIAVYQHKVPGHGDHDDDEVADNH